MKPERTDNPRVDHAPGIGSKVTDLNPRSPTFSESMVVERRALGLLGVWLYGRCIHETVMSEEAGAGFRARIVVNSEFAAPYEDEELV